MKLLRIVLLSIFLVAPVAPVALTTGCATSERTREAVVWDTCQSVWNAAFNAYLAYSELYVKGEVSEENKQEADKAWNQFRTSFKLTITSASLDWNSAPPEQIQRLAAGFIQFLNNLP